MKYFFLAEGWEIGRVWAEGGWNESAWRRSPDIRKLALSIWETGEQLWLYQVEEVVLMVEVKPIPGNSSRSVSPEIGQVILKRLILAEQVIQLLCQSEAIQKGNL
jgi:hypothetical protein